MVPSRLAVAEPFLAFVMIVSFVKSNPVSTSTSLATTSNLTNVSSLTEVMSLFATVDIVTGILGKELVHSDTIFNSFVIVTLGAFGIAEAGQIFGKKEKEED